MSTRLPLVCFVVGPAGSGKSTVARAIARASQACLLDKDSIGEEFVDALLEEKGYESGERESNDYYRSRVMPLEYRSLFRSASDNLQIGNDVVIDAPFAAYLRDPVYLNEMTSTFTWPEATSVVAHVITDPLLIRGRLEDRGLWRDRWKLGNWEEFWEKFSSTECLWDGATHIDVPNHEEPDLRSWLELLR